MTTAEAIREVRQDDLPAIVRLVNSCGFPARSAEGWRWVLFGNPQQGEIPPGWVFERAGGVSGFLGNFINTYRRGGSSIRIATGHTVITDQVRGRQSGLKLIRHGIAQPGVDAFLTLNNNALSAPLLPRVGALPWLGPSGREWVEWILRPSRAVRALLPPAGPAERFDCHPGFAFNVEGRRGGIVFVSLDDVGDDELAAITADDVLARQIDSVSLRYRLSDPDRRGGMSYVIARSGGRALALAALLLTKPSPERLDHAEIVDWAGSGSEAGIRAQRALLCHLVEIARRAGASKLRLHFPSSVSAAVLRAAGPYLRRSHGHDPCHGHIRNGALAGWQPGPGDADYFFAYRIPPALFAAGEQSDDIMR
ncbi:hypothetical protein X907_1194 [Glycocaulis alkaliphilus]|uniref:Uncharacterized protein n=1 Tax=Glycocaulis alkaliphilus TaxID=1434191 RepID=A0A3T0E8Z3_9PROT|nr:hypothetical protein [Glycocaulis alkaliphilus]AZU03732.1 hypothetical protein X907_1194 [Glycocaulis alkaliphilus]GGB83523.1 hypothetical protein GCM10007417_24350 [Glycocaulis alkaliphilus]